MPKDTTLGWKFARPNFEYPTIKSLRPPNNTPNNSAIVLKNSNHNNRQSLIWSLWTLTCWRVWMEFLYELKIKKDWPVTWSLIRVLWVIARELGSHAQPIAVTRSGHNIVTLLVLFGGMYQLTGPWRIIAQIPLSLTWLPDSWPMTRRILNKLQLAGKSLLIFNCFIFWCLMLPLVLSRQ